MGSAITDSKAPRATRSRIDDLVFARLKQVGLKPNAPCSDEVFLRRAFIDVIGTLPTPKEAEEFLAGKATDKRSKLIAGLLWRDEFADYWAMKWSDLLRVKSEFPMDLWPLAAQGYHRWIRDSLRANLPYDRFVRTLLTSSGSDFATPPVNFYRAVSSKTPEPIAKAVALTFMGVRAEKWPKGRLSGMAAFFSQIGYKRTDEWKEEIVFFDPGKPAGQAVFPDGKACHLSPDRDPREVFADWLITPENPWFSLNIVNRIWSWLFGRGIIQEPDDIRPDNPPQNPALLTYLESELVSSGYNLKHVFRLILESGTYQQSSAEQAAHADENFARYPIRRLEAEVLIDALDQITGTTESYSSSIPEPFTFIPEEQRSILLPDGSITSAFLEMFGRPPRDTGFESERNNRPSSDQMLHLLNSSHMQRKIERGPKMLELMRPGLDPRDVCDQLYLSILSRHPADAEQEIVAGHFRSSENRRAAVADVAWALINSAEFLYRH
ncbi:MAG TPA: DUF1553 domain-containing protein [Fimbriimonadaceae bacterium]|nr:DUF1553 domain-containing protein [Fimbriimonadaceae bacterium]